MFYIVFHACKGSWKLKTEAPVSHRKQCSSKASSVPIRPLILWLCDITLGHQLSQTWGIYVLILHIRIYFAQLLFCCWRCWVRHVWPIHKYYILMKMYNTQRILPSVFAVWGLLTRFTKCLSYNLQGKHSCLSSSGRNKHHADILYHIQLSLCICVVKSQTWFDWPATLTLLYIIRPCLNLVVWCFFVSNDGRITVFSRSHWWN